MSLCKPLGASQGGTRCSFLSIRAFLRDLGIKKRDNGGDPVSGKSRWSLFLFEHTAFRKG